jgi:hypothetical protein
MEEFSEVMLDLGDHPPRPIPGGGLILEAPVADQRGMARSKTSLAGRRMAYGTPRRSSASYRAGSENAASARTTTVYPRGAMTARGAAQLREVLGVSVRTLGRWRRWWRESFVAVLTCLAPSTTRPLSGARTAMAGCDPQRMRLVPRQAGLVG